MTLAAIADREPSRPEACACFAVVLFMPDAALLMRLVEGIGGARLFAFANGPLAEDAAAAFATANVVIARSPENLGLGHGLNAVMEAADREGFSHVLLLDQDSVPLPGDLDALFGRMRELERDRGKVALLAPILVPPVGETYKPIRYEWHGEDHGVAVRAVDFAPTSGSLVSVAAYREIGRFRDDFFIGGIDVEWGFRAWARGWASLVATDRTMEHRWGEPAPAQRRAQILRHEPVRNYYYARNAVATLKLAHVTLKWRVKSLAILAAQLALLALRGNQDSFRFAWRGVRDGMSGRLGPGPEPPRQR
jgi:rhamnosyltransferase